MHQSLLQDYLQRLGERKGHRVIRNRKVQNRPRPILPLAPMKT